MDQYDMYDMGDECYENDGYYQSSKEKSKYEVVTQLNIFAQVTTLVNQTSQTVALPFGWSMLLLKEFKWQIDNIGNYFQKIQYYKDLIHYSPKLMTAEQARKEAKKGDCIVCCMQNRKLVMNICKDSFCVDCWQGQISVHLDRKNPFMGCMNINCKTPILHETIEQILNDKQSQKSTKIYNRYLKIICEFFTNTNRSYRCCPGVDCNYCIKCDNYTVTTVKCMCGTSFCFKCNNDDHSPCTCEERFKWIDIVLKEQANAKWIAQNAKVCPWCKKAVERSQGCNFMACVCGKNFCYMCSKPWQPDHKDHFKCNMYQNKDEEQLKLQKSILEKLNFYAQKYLRTNSLVKELKSVDIFEKRTILYNKLYINLTESDFIEDAYKFAIQCCESLKWLYVYNYFVEIVDKNRKERIDFSQCQYQSFKEHLMKKLSIDLRYFIENVRKEAELYGGKLDDIRVKQLTNQFSKIKLNIINYYKFTKQFKQKFIEELQQLDDHLVKRHEQYKQPANNNDNKTKKEKDKTKKGWF